MIESVCFSNEHKFEPSKFSTGYETCIWCHVTRPIVQRSPTLRAPVQTEQKCPACDGIGSMRFLWLTLHCSTCHGTGISNRSVGG